MRKAIVSFGIAFLVTGVLLAALSTALGQDAPEAALVSDDGVSLTVYNEGTALIQDRRTFDLRTGLNSVHFTDVAATIDRTSVSFLSLTDPAGTRILEQNFVFDLVGRSALLQRYTDETVEVMTTDGATYRGQLLSGRDGHIILRTDGGEVLAIAEATILDVRFPELPEGLITRPTLHWLVYSDTDGAQPVELTYLAAGITWTATYIVLLDRETSTLDLDGWVTLDNRCGRAFQDAQLKLVAGDVHRIQPHLPVSGMLALPTATAAMLADEMDNGVEQREFFEYQLYEVARPVTVGDNETKQVEFVSETAIPATIYYVYAASPDYSHPYRAIVDPEYGQTTRANVGTFLEFTTGEENGLGADLPAGTARVYQADVDGAALFIREDSIDHTPEGEEIDLFLGTATDLVGRRTQTDFKLLHVSGVFGLFSGDVLQEAYEIRLYNFKDEATVEIRVPEHLFRWSNWDILNATHPYEQLDSNTIEFRVEVPPRASVTLRYTVQYSWPG